jgi:peptidoglycan/xylan/chitin deacetylase (PgdA/CDA1 family)
MPLLLFLLGAGVVLVSHVAPFPMLLDALDADRVVWRMPRASGDRTVYLTYDDGPNPAATPAVLDVLRAEGVPATFFVIDRHLTPETAPIVRRAFEEGHAVGLHSHTRRKMFRRPYELAVTLAAAADRVEQLAGHRPCRAFRPHAGARSGEMLAALDLIDYQMVGWGFMLWDFDFFRRPLPERVARRIARHASPGDIVVVHDGHHEDPRADRRHTVETTRRLIRLLRDQGFTFGKICGEDGRVTLEMPNAKCQMPNGRPPERS